MHRWTIDNICVVEQSLRSWTMSCMFLPWSLSALQWGTVIPVSKGTLPFYKYICIWIVVCCYRTFLPIHAQLVSTRIGWLIVVGGEFQRTTHQGGGNTLQRGQKRDLFMSDCFFLWPDFISIGSECAADSAASQENVSERKITGTICKSLNIQGRFCNVYSWFCQIFDIELWDATYK